MKPLPPSRYRVVERGRRLEVIDVARGEPVRSAPDTARAGMHDTRPNAVPSLWPRQLSFDGTAELRTSRFYDAKGPRTVLLVPANAAWVKLVIVALFGGLVAFVGAAIMWPLLLPGPLLVHFAGIGALLRKRATKWLDEAEEAGR